jgi:regulator of sigma E protease
MIVDLLATLLTLGILIAVHEYGHYRVAVACGVRVLRFSIGFGRVLLRRQRSENDTEFVVSMVPLGGYVRMLDEAEGPVDADQLTRAFNRQTLARRAAIVAAGPLTNLLLAVLLYAAVQWIGVQEPLAILSPPPAGSLAEQAGFHAGDRVLAWREEDSSTGDWQEISAIGDLRMSVTRMAIRRQAMAFQVRSDGRSSPRELRLDPTRLASQEIDETLLSRIGLDGPYRDPVIASVKAGGPAAAAGVLDGDRVIALDGQPVADAGALIAAIRASVDGDNGRTMRWTVERGRGIVNVEVSPRVVREGGQVLGRVDVAIGAPPTLVLVQRGPVDGLVAGARETWDTIGMTADMFVRMVTGRASWKNLSGPVTIAEFAGKSIRRSLPDYLRFLALLSVSLGVLNLLPLPLLDGGHLLYYLFEGVTGRPVTGLWLARLQRGGLAILMLMMSVALYNDVARRLMSQH